MNSVGCSASSTLSPNSVRRSRSLTRTFTTRHRRCGEATLVNYTKSGVRFVHTVTVEPLVNSYGQVRMIRARSSDIELLLNLPSLTTLLVFGL